MSANNITKYDLEDGSYLGQFYAAISGPTRMQIGPDRLIYVLQWTGDRFVKRFKRDGTFVDSFTDVQIPQSIGMTWDSEGNFYVSTFSQGNGKSFVQRFDAEGNSLGKFVKENLQGATNIWFEGSDFMVHDYPQGIIKRFDQDGNFVENHITGLNQPEGMGRLPDGNILIGNGGTGAIKMYDKDGEFIKDYLPSGAEGLKKPNAVVIRRVN